MTSIFKLDLQSHGEPQC